MTNKEAIDNIKFTPLMRLENENGELKESLTMAIEALEKQIPKKPYFEGDGYADGELVYDTWICPNCGMRYEYYDETYQIEYCSFCGQKIDWSDIE